MAKITTAPSPSQNRKVIYGHGFHHPFVVSEEAVGSMGIISTPSLPRRGRRYMAMDPQHRFHFTERARVYMAVVAITHHPCPFSEEARWCMVRTTPPSLSQRSSVIYGHGHHNPLPLSQKKKEHVWA